MKLPILKELKYLSPTSLGEWTRCEMLFYLKRLSVHPYVSSPQTNPAAIGTMFDILVKLAIAQAIDYPVTEDFTLDALIKKNIEPQCEGIAVQAGNRLFAEYVRNGCLKRLIDEGVQYIELTKKEALLHAEEEVVFLGLPDLMMKDGRLIELKVSGAASVNGASPCPGYKTYFTSGINQGAHEKFREPLDKLNPGWAEQLTIYSWLYNNPFPLRPIPVGVEQLCVSKAGKIICTSIRTTVSTEFQLLIWKRAVDAWQRARDGEITDAQPSEERCHKWGQVCEVADKCEAYQKWKTSEHPFDELMRR